MRLLALALVVALAGCAGPDLGREVEGHVDAGHVRAHAERGIGAFVAEVSGSFLAREAVGVSVDIYLVAGACGSPQGTPEEDLARATLALGDAIGEQTFRYQATLRAEGVVTDAFVYARPHAENAIGPIFGQCVDLTAASASASLP